MTCQKLRGGPGPKKMREVLPSIRQLQRISHLEALLLKQLSGNHWSVRSHDQVGPNAAMGYFSNFKLFLNPVLGSDVSKHY
jgi:hypothetical protein